ncbi:hypothetical protein [uncultured Vibrio sp.]|uniref:hypothetical protein n=1 Tax=uncultured Vibrio sp. TaxID=114054 RepID=UPI0025CE6E91|nr:hypothetical protein [uncultured Vibrio sp.]
MLRLTTLLLSAIVLQGCSNQQASSVGMRKSTITSYPQNMTNIELCETLYFSRSTTQTKAAIGAEFNKRGLKRSWCVEQNNKLYISRAIDSILASSN